MRNQWFPAGKAEYMTAPRFQELGLTRDDVGERDPLFGTTAPLADELEVAEETKAPAVEVHGLAVSSRLIFPFHRLLGAYERSTLPLPPKSTLSTKHPD